MDEILEKFKAFKSRSLAKYSDMNETIKKERKFLSGRQWNKADDKYIAATRNRITLNVISTTCLSVSNSYSAYPFTWNTANDKANERLAEFWKVDSNSFAIEEALLSCVSYGFGLVAIGTDTDVSGEEVPVIYSVTDVDRIFLDPDSSELDYSDAVESALVDWRSPTWIRLNMGDQYVPDEREKSVVGSGSCKELVPIVTYYYLESDGCHVQTFVNERPTGDGMVLPIHRLPLFPVFGETTYDENDKKTYCGIVSKSESIQRIVNYSFTQLAERLALSPKPQFIGYAESFKGNDKYFKRAGSGENPILTANRLGNDGKAELPLPTRLDNTIRYEDVSGIIGSTLDLMPSVTGADSKGLADTQTDVTATAALYTSKVFANNQRHYFSHLKTAMKQIGDCLCTMLGYPGVTVTVVQGPDAYAGLQIARAEIMTMLQTAEPSQRAPLYNALLKTHPDNDVLKNLYAELNAVKQPTPTEIQQQQLIETMKKAIEGKDAEILKLTEQNELLQQQQTSSDKSYRFDLLKTRLDHEYKQSDMVLEAQLRQGAELQKSDAEVAKAEMDAEKAAIQLDTAKVKSDTEIAKVTASMFGGF